MYWTGTFDDQIIMGFLSNAHATSIKVQSKNGIGRV